MAVVTLKYSRNRGQIKAHLRYITHRRGDGAGETITRRLFNESSLTEKEAVYRMIDTSPRGTLFYKIMISPDPIKEDTNKDLDLQQITRLTMLKLARTLQRRLLFVATLHDDHTDKRHVHGIFLLRGRLSRQRFSALAKTARIAATAEACLQRAGRDRVKEHARYPQLMQFLRSLPSQRHRGRGVISRRFQPSCPSCGYGQFTLLPLVLTYCPACHTRLRRGQRANRELGRGGGT